MLNTSKTLKKMLTAEDCKKILFKVGIKLGVSPKLISLRLLDAQDKCDMLNGEIPVEYLEVMVKAWMDAGQPNLSGCQETPKTGCQSLRTEEKQKGPSNFDYQPPFFDLTQDGMGKIA